MTRALIVAAGAVGFAVLTMLVAYALVNGALNREIRAARAGQYAPEIGYRRYIAASLGILRYAALIALLVPLVGVTVVLGNSGASALLFGNTTAASGVGIISGYMMCLFGAVYAIPFSLYDLLTVPLGIRALAALRGIQLGGREAFAYRIKRVLVLYAPVLALCEATGAAAFINVVLAFPVLIVGLIAVTILRRAFAAALVRWTTPSKPIEQTQWAALGPRIHDWGRLAGVRVKAIEVQQTERLGTGSVAAVGSRRGRTLFIADALLRSTDWRQQDALMVYVLTTSATGIVLRGQLLRLLMLLGILAVVAGTFGAEVLLVQGGVSVPPLVLLALALFWLVLLLGLLGFSIFNAIFARQRRRQRFLAADARAVSITGDPLALIVALNTLSALSGVPTDRRVAYFPTTVERVAALDALLRQPGPRAPYAWQLVPSIVPVYVGPYCLTVPLASAPAAAPAPVPAGPYPIVMPPAAPVPMAVPGALATPPVPPMQYPRA